MSASLVQNSHGPHAAQNAHDELAATSPRGLEALVDKAISLFGDKLRVASSFGVEDMIVIDAVAEASAKYSQKPVVFLLDTGRLHQETFDLVERVRDHYKLPIALYAPSSDDIEALVERDGPNGFYASVDARKACCNVRKVHPLSRALKGAGAWLTGLRREQAVTRAEVSPVEVDDAHDGILKINPLFDWTEERVWERAIARKVPVHALHARGFASIGCAPCTRAIQKGEHARAGRWWWEDAAQKECGLHPARGLRK